jgi:hypothetical protein
MYPAIVEAAPKAEATTTVVGAAFGAVFGFTTLGTSATT